MSKPWYPDYARHSRLFRAVGDVLKTYDIERGAPHPRDPSRVELSVARSPRAHYLVTLRTDWSEPPICSCPDHSERDPELRGFCKHVIAACLSYDDLRCQVLDLML